MASLPKPPKPQVLQADDGVVLSYYTVGSGPGIIVVPGSMSSALSQYELAVTLSSSYTVYLLSRRSRGLSGPYPPSVANIKNPLLQPRPEVSSQTDLNRSLDPVYEAQFTQEVLQTDLADLAALRRHTGASTIFGISSGAVLVLAACIYPGPSLDDKVVPPIQKAIIFDPPLLLTTPPIPPHDMLHLSGVRRYEAEIARGDVTASLVTGMRIVQLGPRWLRACPDFILRFMTGLIMSAEAKEQARKETAGEEDEGSVTMEKLAPVMRYDFALVQEMMGNAARFSEITVGKKILLVGGANSPGYMKHALRGLVDVLTESGNAEGMSWKEVKDVGHELFENKQRNGKVELGIEIVKEFLGGAMDTNMSSH